MQEGRAPFLFSTSYNKSLASLTAHPSAGPHVASLQVRKFLNSKSSLFFLLAQQGSSALNQDFLEAV